MDSLELDDKARGILTVCLVERAAR